MLDANTSDDHWRNGQRPPERAAPRATRRPVLIILHQPHSTPGHVGNRLRARGHALDIRRPRFGDPLPETLKGHAGVVIFGGPMSANDRENYMTLETDYIGTAMRQNTPFLGICLGAQMLARLHGAQVDFHPEGAVEIGYHDIQPTADAERLFGAWPSRVYQWHREGFELPSGATALATSKGPFPQQAFVCGENAVGVQFHPEMTWAMLNRWSGSNPIRLFLRGAQPREEQQAEHLLRAAATIGWLDNFLDRWLAKSDRAIPVSV